MKTDDEAIFGIKYNLERYVLVTWCVTVFIVSVIGDYIIIETLASKEVRAIKCNKVILSVMQHLAFIDLFSAIFSILPRIAALIANEWVFGKFLGHVEVHTLNIFYTVTALLTCLMTIFKLACLRDPLRTFSLSKCFGHKICAFIWALALVFNIPSILGILLYVGDTLYFGYLWFGCSYEFKSFKAVSWLAVYYLICHGLMTIFPFLTLLITSILILLVAKRSASRFGETLKRKGVLTVLLTALVYLVSLLPYFIDSFLETSSAIHRAAFFLTFLNTMANIFIYLLTIPAFRCILRVKLGHYYSP